MRTMFFYLQENKEYEFAGIYKPHLGLGGDYYDLIHIDEDNIAFCICDDVAIGISLI